LGGFLVLGYYTEIRRGAQRNAKGLFWNAEYTDLAEDCGFSTALFSTTALIWGCDAEIHRGGAERRGGFLEHGIHGLTDNH